MTERNKANPATLILMLIGIAICVGFIVHGLSANTPTPVTTLPAQNGAASTVIPPVTPPGATTVAPAPTVLTSEGGDAIFAEADMAPNIDPFTPIGGWRAAPTTDVAQAVAPVVPTKSPTLAAQPTKSQPAVSGGLAGFDIQEPELVGTMLGDQPSAVFRVDQRIVMVGLGSKIIGWKVVSIQQGAAVLQGMGRTRRLTTGRPSIADGSVKQSTSLKSGSASQIESAAASSPASRTDPGAGGTENIKVSTVEVPAGRSDQSSLPQRTDSYGPTSEETSESNSVAVSGPFVSPAPQLSGAVDAASDARRNTRGSSVPPSHEPYPEPMQTPVEYRTALSGSEDASDTNPNLAVAQGPEPRHHRKRRRRRHNRPIHRHIAAHAHHHRRQKHNVDTR
jgi:hypothetical protein